MYYTEERDGDIAGNNTPIFFVRDPLKLPTSFTPKSGTRAPTYVLGRRSARYRGTHNAYEALVTTDETKSRNTRVLGGT